MSDDQFIPLMVVKNALYVPAAAMGISLDSVIILAVLLGFDIFTGIWRSFLINGGNSITSFKAISGFFSKFSFVAIPVVVMYMGRGVGIDLGPLAQMALGVLILGTGYSILGNIYTIRTGRTVKEFDALQFILYQLQKLIEKYTVPPDHKI